MHEPLHETEEETLHLEAHKAVDDETGELGLFSISNHEPPVNQLILQVQDFAVFFILISFLKQELKKCFNEIFWANGIFGIAMR